MSEAKPHKPRTLAAVAPYMPAEYDVADVSAFQALERGEANDEQQKRALNWIIVHCSRMYDFHFYPNDRDTSFALGRAFVGQQVVKLLRLNNRALMRKEAQ